MFNARANSMSLTRPRILKEVLCLLKARAVNYKEYEKFALNINVHISYYLSDDHILGPHSNVQVTMVRGVFASWKQYDFDVTMTSELLKNIIREREACGIRVVSVTCGMGGNMLNVTGRSCENAPLLFSWCTALAVRYMLNKNTESNFSELVNDTINVLNSIIVSKGEKTPPQEWIWFEFEEPRKYFKAVIPQLRAGSRKSLLLLQKSFVTSIKSLIGLFEDMRTWVVLILKNNLLFHTKPLSTGYQFPREGLLVRSKNSAKK
ncbi:hypothetical protein PR048_022702 [Dryococelus australis]|uniref:Uncharacterized protein n=1 Tax=Dryococelus australis TaxID=614101 RepID=A0ABQ9GS23_9NEOP|nr:hypothetical protein PR048_022702 [Dryococelus australis]